MQITFGRGRDHKRSGLWREAAEEVGGEYHPRRHQRPDTLQLRYRDCIITLDAGPRPESHGGTRLRLPFVNWSGFHFLIYPASPFSEFSKKLVLLQDLDIGHPGIDRRYIVQSGRPDGVRDLFRNDRVRELVWAHKKKMRLGISENGGVLGGKYPDGVDLLYYHTPVELKEVQAIVDRFDLFKAILDHVSPVDDDEVEHHMTRLRAPGGIITGKLTLWEGGPPRHDAIDRLAELKDPRAVELLLETLTDPDPILQSKAVYALGQIGDPSTLPELIRLLGRRQGQLKRKLADDAGDALEIMGHGDLVEAFNTALEGDPGPLAKASKAHRSEVIDALVAALEGPGRLVVSHTVQALSKLGAVEALPVLRSRLNNYMLASVREAYEEAIAALQARTSLPRAAGPTVATSETLPRASDERDQEPPLGDVPSGSEELDSPA